MADEYCRHGFSSEIRVDEYCQTGFSSEIGAKQKKNCHKSVTVPCITTLEASLKDKLKKYFKNSTKCVKGNIYVQNHKEIYLRNLLLKLLFFCVHLLASRKVENDAKQDPHAEHNVGFCAEMNAGEARNRYQLKHHKSEGEYDADDGQNTEAEFRIFVTFRSNQSRCGSEEVTDGCADRRHIYKPAQSFSSEDGAGKRHDDAENHGIAGGLESVQTAEHLRQIAILRHGIHKAGGSQIEAHNT